MKTNDWLQLGLYFGALILLAPLLGNWMARIFKGERTPATGWLTGFEKLIYRLCGINPAQEMKWTTYLGALLAFNALGFLLVLALQMTQASLPLNVANLANVPVALAVNTAVSFVTNTNWQAYSGEAVMSYLTQMLALGVQNFLSAATGIAVIVALARGLSRQTAQGIGNFWSDMVRALVHVLLPLSFIFALVLVSQGVVQDFAPYTEVTTVEGAAQTIPLGPAASQIAIKQLGTNGGGFFGVNSAHPFENPTPLSNFLQCLAILLIPAALPFTFGRLTGNISHGRCLFVAMLVLLVAGLGVTLMGEYQSPGQLTSSAWLEGKETRLGIVNSALWSTATTAASNGSVNAMHGSMSPLANMVQLINIQLGEVIFGGAGAGMYGMIMFVILTVFMAGLMVGRTPEYLGKKIELREIIWTVIAVLIPCALILVGTAISTMNESALASRGNGGAHGFSEILYAWTSAAGNNGSALGGLTANTDFYNWGLSLAMLVGRFGIIIPALAIAGSLAAKKTAPPSPGTFPTDGGTFVLLLIAVILIVGGLTFLPALSLGPIVEHGLLQNGRSF